MQLALEFQCKNNKAVELLVAGVYTDLRWALWKGSFLLLFWKTYCELLMIQLLGFYLRRTIKVNFKES